MTQDAWLIDERWEKAYRITAMLSIGRGPENGVILRDPAVSRLHATVCDEDGSFLLRSFGQSGTTLNGTPAVGECVLHEGDRIEIASSTLRFTHRSPDADAIVLEHDTPVSLDRLAPATRSWAVPPLNRAHSGTAFRTGLVALAIAASALLLLLALR